MFKVKFLDGAEREFGTLKEANLKGAYLKGAYLKEANLRGANLEGENLKWANLTHFQIPQEGSLIVYKKVNNKVLKLEVPEGAKRTASLVGRKCRAEFVKVLEISDGNSYIVNKSKSHIIKYSIGRTVYPDFYDDDPRVECTHGIHFFLTRKEAEEY